MQLKYKNSWSCVNSKSIRGICLRFTSRPSANCTLKLLAPNQGKCISAADLDTIWCFSGNIARNDLERSAAAVISAPSNNDLNCNKNTFIYISSWRLYIYYPPPICL